MTEDQIRDFERIKKEQEELATKKVWELNRLSNLSSIIPKPLEKLFCKLCPECRRVLDKEKYLSFTRHYCSCGYEYVTHPSEER